MVVRQVENLNSKGSPLDLDLGGPLFAQPNLVFCSFFRLRG